MRTVLIRCSVRGMNKPLRVLALAAASVIALAGCAATTPEGSDAAGDRIRIVASTNVYGSLAEQIGGDRVEVTSIITSASQDPHSYEATARDRLAVQNADLVIENGGGYDHFMRQLREDSAAPVVTAVVHSHDHPENAGHPEGTEGADRDGEHHGDADHDHAEDEGHAHDHDHPDHEGHNHIAGFNEHVWYSPHTMIHVVEAIAEELGALDADGAAGFAAASDAIISDLRAIEDELDALAAEVGGIGVFLTEPLPGYLATQLGLVDHAPDGFAAAVEEGSDVTPATLLAALKAIEAGEVSAVLSNAQTGGPETERVEEAAADAGIPVLTFTELLEDGTSYAEWMRDAISDLAAALRA